MRKTPNTATFVFPLTLALLGATSLATVTKAEDPAIRKKAGLYLRLDAGAKKEATIFKGSPLLDAVVLMIRWRNVEPKRGQFHLQPMMEEVDEWGRAGKGVVLSLEPYGQTFDRRGQT